MPICRRTPTRYPLQPGQFVTAEIWKGKVTLVSAGGKAQQTYSNPAWHANDSQWAVAVPLLFLFLSSLCMACVGLAMWRQRQRARVG